MDFFLSAMSSLRNVAQSSAGCNPIVEKIINFPSLLGNRRECCNASAGKVLLAISIEKHNIEQKVSPVQ